MSSDQFNRGKEKAITGSNPPRRGRGGASGSTPNPAHTPSSNSIPSQNFGDYVPNYLTEEQINEMFEVSKLIHEDDEQEQPTKPKQRKPSELKSPLFGLAILQEAYAPIREAIMYLIRHSSLGKNGKGTA
ncbi:hypothetical protein OROMI_014642 [Orobanche minor]